MELKEKSRGQKPAAHEQDSNRQTALPRKGKSFGTDGTLHERSEKTKPTVEHNLPIAINLRIEPI